MSEFYSGPRTVGGIATFNIQDSFVEALARGYRSGFLTDTARRDSAEDDWAP